MRPREARPPARTPRRTRRAHPLVCLPRVGMRPRGRAPLRGPSCRTIGIAVRVHSPILVAPRASASEDSGRNHTQELLPLAYHLDIAARLEALEPRGWAGFARAAAQPPSIPSLAAEGEEVAAADDLE